MNSICLLDTNAAVALLNGSPGIEQMIGTMAEVFVPVIVLDELYYGAEKSSRIETNLKRVNEFAERYAVLLCDVQTAREYDRVQRELRTKGQPIQPNDMWIAALARTSAQSDGFNEGHRFQPRRRPERAVVVTRTLECRGYEARQ